MPDLEEQLAKIGLVLHMINGVPAQHESNWSVQQYDPKQIMQLKVVPASEAATVIGGHCFHKNVPSMILSRESSTSYMRPREHHKASHTICCSVASSNPKPLTLSPQAVTYQ